MGTSAFGAGAGGEGSLKGVTLSFWPGNGSNPANASKTMTMTAIAIQILMAIHRVGWTFGNAGEACLRASSKRDAAGNHSLGFSSP